MYVVAVITASLSACIMEVPTNDAYGEQPTDDQSVDGQIVRVTARTANGGAMSTNIFGDHERDVMAAHNDVGRVLARPGSYQEIVDAAEAFGARFLPIFEGPHDRGAARQIRRLVASAHLDAAITTGVPLDQCECLVARYFALGVESIYALSLKIGNWAGYCEDQVDAARALHYLRPLVEDLEDEHARTGDTTIANCLESARRALARAQPGCP